MMRLTIGVLLWSVVHFMPVVAVDMKKAMVNRLGAGPFKGLFSLLMVLALYLIISGWKTAIPEIVYVTPVWGNYAAILLVMVAFVLFLAPYPPNNIKRMMRHPQLVGMACWGAGHLLANGDVRSLVLFGGLTAWALIEIVLLNRRDGAWTKPASVSGRKDVTLVVFGILTFMVFMYTHHMIFGGSPLT